MKILVVDGLRSYFDEIVEVSQLLHRSPIALLQNSLGVFSIYFSRANNTLMGINRENWFLDGLLTRETRECKLSCRLTQTY